MNTLVTSKISKKLIIFRFFLYLLKKILSKNKFNFAIYSNDYIGRNLIFKEFYEEEYLNCFVKFLSVNNINVMNFIDVGANIGNHSIFFNNICKNIFSFEPSSKAFELLKINTKFTNIKIFKLGISNKKGTALLTESKNNLGGSNIIKNVKKKHFFTEKVKINKLDNLKFLRSKKIDLIKIDTEGHEYKVLKGAINIIRKNFPIILLEQNMVDIIGGKSKTLNFLDKCGYFFYEVDAELYNSNTNYFNKFYLLFKHLFYSKKARMLKLDINFLKKKDYRMIVALNSKLK